MPESPHPLANVNLAFKWLSSYFEELAQLVEAARSAFELKGFESLTGTNIEFAASKSLSRHRDWMAWYAYSFFKGEASGDGDADAGDSLFALLFSSFHKDHPDRLPVVWLCRFTPLAGPVTSDLKGKIIYQWDMGEDSLLSNGWWHGASDKVGVAYWYKRVDLAEIKTLDDVEPLLVDPLVEGRWKAPAEG